MARGGKRAGAGRKIGAKGKLNERAAKTIDKGILPLDFLLGVMRNQKEEPSIRLEAAKSAAPFIHRRQPQEIDVAGGIDSTLNVTIEVVGKPT